MYESSTTQHKADANARIGTWLRGKWHLDALLGVGGMGAVYAATHRNGKRGAVKILHSSIGESDARRRFFREGRIANRVEHDGVVSVIDDDTSEDGDPFLVMELLDGETLGALARRSKDRVPVEVVLLVVHQALDALTAAHDKQIVHRDIKPENLFLTNDARVKLLDFGIARLAEPRDLYFAATQPGASMGTPAFMAPEQARGRWDLVGPETDLWSVGATMFTLITGELVHETDTMAELLAAIVSRPARPLTTVRPSTPRVVADIVDRALQLKMAERWHDARDMQLAVAEAYCALTGKEIAARPSRAASSVPRAVSRWDITTRLPALSSVPSIELIDADDSTGSARRARALGIAMVAITIAMTSLVALRSTTVTTAAAARMVDWSSAFAVATAARPVAPARPAPSALAIAPPPKPESAPPVRPRPATARLTPMVADMPPPVVAPPSPAPSSAAPSASDQADRALFQRRL